MELDVIWQYSVYPSAWESNIGFNLQHQNQTTQQPNKARQNPSKGAQTPSQYNKDFL